MREDLTQFGIQETRTPEELDDVIANTPGTVMVVVNSVCGCAAGLARPAIGMAIKHSVIPDKVVTVFAGADIAAVDHARNAYFKGYFPTKRQDRLDAGAASDRRPRSPGHREGSDGCI